MNRIQYTLTFLLLSFFGQIAAQEVLDQYLQTAAENNPGLKARFNEYMAALEKVPQVGALPDPTLAFGYFIRPVETRLGPQNAKIAVSQMFPWFGTLSAREQAEESFARAKFELFKETKSKLFYDVKSTYYNLSFTASAIDITVENIEILSSFRQLANVKIESGLTSAIDAYRIEMEINNLEDQLAQLRDDLNKMKVKFNKLINVDIDSNIEVEKIPGEIALNKQAELDSVLLNNNVLTSYDYQLQGLHYKAQSASKEGKPQFSAGFEYSIIGAGTSTAENAGRDALVFPRVGISIPLYRSKYNAKVREVDFLREAKTFERSEKENNLIILFESVWNDYSDAIRRHELYEAQVGLAKKSLSILESDYANNSQDFEEILRMERMLLKYALELEKAKTDKQAAIAFIDYMKGV